MKELRINFPDYTVDEQERDVERFKRLEKKYQPHIFLLKFDGIWASMTFSNGIKHRFYEGMNLYQTFNKVKETHPNHKMKYIINQGLENYLREQRRKEQILKSKQLTINFK
jgi:hypothetical protein